MDNQPQTTHDARRLSWVPPQLAAGVPSLTPEAYRAAVERNQRAAGGDGDPGCEHCHGLGWLRQDVPPGHPRFGKLDPCLCRQARLDHAQAERLRAKGQLTALADKTFDNFLPEGATRDPAARASLGAAFKRCQAYAEAPEGWLLLHGSYGCGKTHLAAAIANRSLALGRRVIFFTAPDLLDELRAGFAPGSDEGYAERFDELRQVALLVLDDLGAESATPWAQEKLYQLVNARYQAGLPTVVTTNRDLSALEARVASRLSDASLVAALAIRAPDFRSGAALSAELSAVSLNARKTFETFQPRADLPADAQARVVSVVRAAHAYAARPEGWFVLVGPYGAGKTHLAAAIANAWRARGRPVVFIAHADLLDLFRPGAHAEDAARAARLVREVKLCEHVVIDDLSLSGDAPGYFRTRLFQILAYRFEAELPTVLTTAVEEKELDPRLRAHLRGGGGQLHVLACPPYRGRPAKGGGT